jgi:hypothetical protein
MPKATHQHTTSRRALLAGAAAAPTLALPAIAAAEAPDPHPRWRAEWRSLIDRYNTPGAVADEDAEDCPEWRRIIELERLAAGTPARSLAGVAAQLGLALAFIAEYGSLGDGVNDEALLQSALATLERLAGEATA